MANKDATEARVKNVMKDLPPQVFKPVPKMRNTLKQSFSGMKTILNQIAAKGQMKKAYDMKKIRVENKTKKYLVGVIIAMVIIIIVIALVILLR